MLPAVSKLRPAKINDFLADGSSHDDHAICTEIVITLDRRQAQSDDLRAQGMTLAGRNVTS
jgi:hypothetical protein